MIAETPTYVSPRLNRNVLLQSWAQLSVYDRTASALKHNFVQRRNVVIGMTLAATIGSVLTGVLGQTVVSVIIAVISITLPIIASYLMNDIIKFTGTTAWIKYRYTAETMRMYIFLYRMKAGIFAPGPIEKMDTRLSETLIKVRSEVKWDEVIPPSVREPIDEDAIITVIKEANSQTSEDDGLSEIEIDKYINWRVTKQREWYNGKIHDDFARLKFFVRWGQFFLLIGALFSALVGSSVNIQIVTLVAVTNAISVALTSWSGVSMVGTTYSIFQIVSDRLADEERNWKALQDDPEMQDPVTLNTEIANFVQRVENILMWERQEWYETALQAQSRGDKMILGDLTRLTQRADAAHNQQDASAVGS